MTFIDKYNKTAAYLLLSILKTDPYGEGWLAKFQITDTTQAKNFMSAGQYDQFIREEQG
jgi:glycine cleavage system H lipoate-binding protein